jgi:HAD superfamily hydrolase (TIGR01490 family)
MGNDSKPSIAFFDMDKTVLSRSSTTLWLKYMWRNRMLTVREASMAICVSVAYGLRLMDFPRVVAWLSYAFRDGDVHATRELADAWVREELLGYVTQPAVERIRAHQAAGEEVWLLSAATQFVVRPVAEFLGVACRFTELEVVDGRITGYVAGEACYGAGKVTWAERIAKERGAVLADCAFYTDSITDRPLLERVGRPVAVNPDRRLEKVAKERGWAVERFY